MANLNRSYTNCVCYLLSKPTLLLAFPLLLVLSVGCGGPADNGANVEAASSRVSPVEDAIAVRIAPLREELISSLYSTSATLRADRRATVIARTRGVVRQLEVEEGDIVVAGQAMAYLEDAEQKIAAARARTARDTSKREVDRLSGLHERGLVSEDEFERARRNADDAQHVLDLAELELSRTVIRAPIGGRVLVRHLDVGATIGDGTAVYDLADLDPLYADVNIPERHVTRLDIGQEVRLSADATGEAVLAKIERIAPQVDPSTGTVKVTVAVTGSSRLRPGAFVRVDIVTETHENALVVPRSALVAEGRRWQLYRFNETESTVELIDVEIGFESGDRVEIVGPTDSSKTLEVGDPLVYIGAPALSDGATVRVMTDESPKSESGEHAE